MNEMRPILLGFTMYTFNFPSFSVTTTEVPTDGEGQGKDTCRQDGVDRRSSGSSGTELKPQARSRHAVLCRLRL